jgi:hypothetical protein
VEWLRLSMNTNQNSPMTYFLLASALAHLGRRTEASAAADRGLSFEPSTTIRRYGQMLKGATDNRVWHAQADRIIEGLRKAGVPEG